MSIKNKLFIALGVIGLIAFFVGYYIAFQQGSEEIKAWYADIDDPTERGCLYITGAIIVHAFVTWISSPNCNCTNEKND